MVSTQTQQLSPAANGSYEPLSVQVIVPGDGYATAYVGNESNADVYFDDITVTHGQGLQVQENQYEPWGMNMAGLDYASPSFKELNRYGFNNKEKEENLGLNWNDYGGRFYDAPLGRWPVADALAGIQSSESPYAYVSNCPTSFTDIGGGFKVPAWMQAKYPHLYQLLEKTAPDIIFNPAALETISLFTHLSQKQIMQDAQLGSGPEIVGAETGDALGRHDTGPILNINERLLSRLEQLAQQGNPEDLRSVEFLVMVTIFHEYIHYGREVAKMQKPIGPYDYSAVTKGKMYITDEAGSNWEVKTFGTTIASNEDSESPSQQPAKKYLNKYEAGRFMPVPGTDVTKGIAPDKKPDGGQRPKTHKPKERKAGQ